MPRPNWYMFVPMLLASASAYAGESCSAQSGGNIVPLVELYTAEGCNDCPPADRWLSKLSRSIQPDRATMLAFHVDYWDSIGWTDHFASPLNGKRQEMRVRLANKKVIVTPQVMIGKDVMVNWRTPSQPESVMAKARSRSASMNLVLKFTGQGVNLQVQRGSGEAKDVDPVLVWLALYQDGLTSEVSAGENKGVTLHHDHVVRALVGPWKMDGEALAKQVQMQLPVEAKQEQLGLVLFVESGKTGEGLQSLALPLSSCPRL